MSVVALTYMIVADSARTTQLLQAALNVIDAALAGHGYRENGFEDGYRHLGCLKLREEFRKKN